jgi:hypothetical protein
MALFIVVFGYGMRYLKKKTRVFKVDWSYLLSEIKDLTLLQATP